MFHLANYLEKTNVKAKAPLSRCLQTAKKRVLNFIRQFKTYFCVRK